MSASSGCSHIYVGGVSFGTSFHAKQWLALDPCGMAGITCSWGVHIYALICISVKLLSNSLAAVLLFFGLYVPAALLAMTALYKAWTTDPGAVPLGARPLTVVRRASSDSLNSSSANNNNNDALATPPPGSFAQQRAMRRCHKCNDNYKPPRAHHDSVTGRCVVKFDHFCPWVGNAVGALNHKFFCLFLLYTAITCSLSLILLLMRVVHCGYTIEDVQEEFAGERNEEYERGEGGGNNRLLLPEGDRLLRSTTSYRYPECQHFYSSHMVLALLLCSILFLVFTCSMGCEQWEAVETGKGKIARMKMRVGQAGTEFSRVTEEFNEMFGGESPQVAWHWFWPVADVSFPRGMKKVVLGYEWDESFDPEPYEPTVCVPAAAATPTAGGGDSGLGDREMDELEGGVKKKGTPPPPPTRDALLMRESSASSMAESVQSEASASTSGIKNRKSPPKL